MCLALDLRSKLVELDLEHGEVVGVPISGQVSHRCFRIF